MTVQDSRNLGQAFLGTSIHKLWCHRCSDSDAEEAALRPRRRTRCCKEIREEGWAQNWDHRREMSRQNIEAVRLLLYRYNLDISRWLRKTQQLYFTQPLTTMVHGLHHSPHPNPGSGIVKFDPALLYIAAITITSGQHALRRGKEQEQGTDGRRARLWRRRRIREIKCRTICTNQPANQHLKWPYSANSYSNR